MTMDKTTARMVELYQETDKTFRQIGREVGLTKDAVKGRLSRFFRKNPDMDVRGNYSEDSCESDYSEEISDSGMSEDEFIKPYDYRAILKEGLEYLESGTDHAVIHDEDFRRALNIPKDKWRRLKKLDEFRKYQLVVNQTIYWCQPETADNLRARIDLAD